MNKDEFMETFKEGYKQGFDDAKNMVGPLILGVIEGLNLAKEQYLRKDCE